MQDRRTINTAPRGGSKVLLWARTSPGSFVLLHQLVTGRTLVADYGWSWCALADRQERPVHLRGRLARSLKVYRRGGRVIAPSGEIAQKSAAS
jgi:hypothetical protein